MDAWEFMLVAVPNIVRNLADSLSRIAWRAVCKSDCTGPVVGREFKYCSAESVTVCEPVATSPKAEYRSPATFLVEIPDTVDTAASNAVAVAKSVAIA